MHCTTTYNRNLMTILMHTIATMCSQIQTRKLCIASSKQKKYSGILWRNQCVGLTIDRSVNHFTNKRVTVLASLSLYIYLFLSVGILGSNNNFVFFFFVFYIITELFILSYDDSMYTVVWLIVLTNAPADARTRERGSDGEAWTWSKMPSN